MKMRLNEQKEETISLVLSVKQTSTMLGVGETSVRKRMKDGEIPFLRVGRRIVIPKAVILEMVDRVLPKVT